MIHMGFLSLTIGSVLTLLFIVSLLRGQKYNYMLDALEPGDFPLKSVYGAGFALQDGKLFALRGKLGDYLRERAKLIYGRKFREFYARAIWAQALSLSLLFAAVCFVLAGILTDMAALLSLLGGVMLVFPGYYFVKHAGDQVNKRQDACEMAFPNAISKMALIVNSGVILHEAWEIVAYGGTGVFYELMQKACEAMKNGASDVDAIYEFGVETNSQEIKKFTSALIQSIERGGGELPGFLATQSKELWAHHRQVLLQKGEKAAGALLMPIALMFVGVVLIVMAAAMQSFAM